MKGSVFSIEEFSVYDGPGIRTVVFFTGCPLRCNWCHNPEGFTLGPKRLRTLAGCQHCGRCESVCRHPDSCIFCGDCERACPQKLIRIVGLPREAGDIAAEVLKNGDLLSASGGGVTLSGGEVTYQPDFLLELLHLLAPLHRAIETCGHVSSDLFRRVLPLCELVMMDIKMTDPERHKQFTGVDNRLIRRNLDILKESGVPFTIRIPLIPGVNDDVENLECTADWIAGSPGLTGVELLPYNRSAGAKYAAQNLTYTPHFDTNANIILHSDVFDARGIPCTVL